MKGAQPLEMTGVTITGHKGAFHDGPFNETKEVIGGYYHLLAKDMDEVVEIVKKDPRFEGSEWKVEIRSVWKVKGIN